MHLCEHPLTLLLLLWLCGSVAPCSDNSNATVCFGCIKQHAASIGPGTAANCSTGDEQEFCEGGGFHRTECKPPAPGTVHLEDRPPVILIPPLSGSFMDWKMVNRKQKHLVCKRNEDWVEFFPPSPEMALPLYSDCYFDDASLVYDAATDLYAYPEGVEIRVNMTLESQCDVDPDPAKAAFTDNRTSFGCVCKNLQAMGYQRRVDFQTLPYDWRLGPKNWMSPGGYFEHLKAYIEEMSHNATSTNKKVTAIGFSLGSPVFALFLQRFVTEAWREQYIASFVSLSGVFGGTAETVLNQLQESSEGGGPPIPWAMDVEFAAEQSYGSFSWMAAILPPESILATAGTEVKYTAAQLPELFAAAGYARVGQQIAGAANYSVYEPVGVEAHIIYANGSETPSHFSFPLKADGTANFSAPCHYSYDSEAAAAAAAAAADDAAGDGGGRRRLQHHPYPPPDPKTECIVSTVDGDDTGTVASLAGVPKEWATKQTQPVHLLALPGLGHDDTQKSSTAMDYLRYPLRKPPPFAMPFIYKNDHFYQDRLGTNIGKVEKRVAAFFAGRCLSTRPKPLLH